MKKFHNTYIANPAGLDRATAALRAQMDRERDQPPSAEDLAWQDHLPELPDDADSDAVHAEFVKE